MKNFEAARKKAVKAMKKALHLSDDEPIDEEITLRAVIEVNKHCLCCPNETIKACKKVKGVKDVVIEHKPGGSHDKDQVTLTGSFDVNQVLYHLRHRAHKIGKVVVAEREEQYETANEGESETTSA